MKQNENDIINYWEEIMSRQKQYYEEKLKSSMQRLRQQEKKHSPIIREFNHALRVQFKKGTNYIVIIENKHNAIADENNQWKLKIDDLSEKLESLKLRLKNYETSTKQLCRQVASKDKKLEKMRSNMEKLKLQIEQSSTETKETERENKQMKSQLKKTSKGSIAASAEITKSKIKLKEVSYNQKVLQQSLQDLQSHNDFLIDEVKEFKKKVPYHTIQREHNIDPEAKGGQNTFPPHI